MYYTFKMPKQEIIELQTCRTLRWNGKNETIHQTHLINYFLKSVITYWAVALNYNGNITPLLCVSLNIHSLCAVNHEILRIRNYILSG